MIRWKRSDDYEVESHCGLWEIRPEFAWSRAHEPRPEFYSLWHYRNGEWMRVDTHTLYTQAEAKQAAENEAWWEEYRALSVKGIYRKSEPWGVRCIECNTRMDQACAKSRGSWDPIWHVCPKGCTAACENVYDVRHYAASYPITMKPERTETNTSALQRSRPEARA